MSIQASKIASYVVDDEAQNGITVDALKSYTVLDAQNGITLASVNAYAVDDEAQNGITINVMKNYVVLDDSHSVCWILRLIPSRSLSTASSRKQKPRSDPGLFRS
jgi:hypothetical protein